MTPPEIKWAKSSRSGSGAGNACIEVGTSEPGTPVLVRDTKDRDGGTLSVSPEAFKAFVDSIK